MRTPGCGRRVRPGQRRSGQALVEFVLIMPILLLLIFGLMDFARAWQTNHAMADAAREGARMLVVAETAGFIDAETAIRQRLIDAGLDDERIGVNFVPDIEPAGRSQPQQVTIRYAYDFWLLRPFLGDRTVNLVSTATMRGEGRN
jgi:Flp pilus assembly protein TadG